MLVAKRESGHIVVFPKDLPGICYDDKTSSCRDCWALASSLGGIAGEAR